MARPFQQRHIESITVASGSSTIGTTQPNPVVSDKGYPAGDEALAALDIYYDGVTNNAAADGTAVTDGEAKFLRALTVETDKHGRIVDSVDGLGIKRINEFRGVNVPDSGAVSAADNSAFRVGLTLPFMSPPNALRPYDSLIDMLKSRMTVRAEFGIFTDLVTGGTGTKNVDDLVMDVSAKVLPGPLVEAPADRTELPLFMPHLSVIKESISTTENNKKIRLPYGDRIYRRIYISQRNSSTFAELETVVTADQFVTLKVNGYPWVDRMAWRELRAKTQREHTGSSSYKAGWAVLDFDSTGRINDMLSTLDRNNGSCELEIDVTSVTNGALWIYLESYMPIPEAARRAAPAA